MSRRAGLLRPFAYGAIAAVSRDRVAGEHVEDALAVATILRKRGYEVTLAYWNHDDESPAAVVSQYMAALDAIDAIGGRAYLSVKAPSFAFDPRLYDELLTRAEGLGVPVHFDSLGADVADRTFSLIMDRSASPLQKIGCTLPGRWQRSPEDAARLGRLGVAVRVVKGEWKDPAAPTLDPTKGFLDVVTRLAGQATNVRIATHDGDLAQQSIRILRQAGTPCDLELLYGFPIHGLLPHLVRIGVPIRIYVPFGHGWIRYCMSRVRERPSFLWRLLRDSLAGRYIEGFPELPPGVTE